MSWGLIVSLNSYRRVILSGDRDNVVGILRRARSKALGNVNQSRHGVFLGASDYILFQGSSYATRAALYDEKIPRSAGLTVSGLAEFVFEPLSGDALASGTVVIGNGIQSSTVSVTYEGRIDW